MLEEYVDRQQSVHMVRKKIQKKSNKVKQQSEKEEISDELEEYIDDLHLAIKQFVETHEKGLEMLEEQIE